MSWKNGPHTALGFGVVDVLIAGCRFFLNRGDLCNLFGVLFGTFCVLMLRPWRKDSMLDLCKIMEFCLIFVNTYEDI